MQRAASTEDGARELLATAASVRGRGVERRDKRTARRATASVCRGLRGELSATAASVRDRGVVRHDERAADAVSS
jgi:hypothetical protein